MSGGVKHMSDCMAISDEIQDATFAIDKTTIFEIKAMIVLPFVSWLTKLAVRCQQKKSTKIFFGYKTLGFLYFLVSVVVVVDVMVAQAR